MAWTTPKTWATNEVATSANFNAQIRDNSNWLANDKPRARAVRSSTQAIASGSDVAIQLNTESFDVGPMHDNVTNNTRLTVPTGGAGVYIVSGYYEMDNGGQARTVGSLRLNGSTFLARTEWIPPTSGGGAPDHMTAIINLLDTDYVELTVNQNSGANVNITFGVLAACWMAF